MVSCEGGRPATMLLVASRCVGRRRPRMQGPTATSFHSVMFVLRLLVLPHRITATVPVDEAKFHAASRSFRSTTPSTLLAAPVETSTEAPSEGAAYDTQAGTAHGGGMTLFKELYGFVLSGNHEPLLREINGGRYCVDPTGIQPPGWRLHGHSLDLHTCAKIASAQEHVVGFKWGSKVYNHSAYMRIAQSENHRSFRPQGPVQLAQLYPQDTEFTCEVFMVDQWGNIPNISLDNFSLLENRTAVPARRLMAQSVAPALFHHGADPKAKKQEFHVCLQRRAMVKFVDRMVPEYWFCYLPEKQWPKCENDMRNYIYQGIAVAAGLLLVLVPLAYLMQHQIHFTWPLVWVTRLVISLQLGVWSIWFLLHLGVNHDVPSLGLSFLALLIVILGNTIVLLPNYFSKACSCCPMLAVVYLLCLVTCPIMFINWATYISPFIQLVNYGPVPVGLVGFALELLKDFLCPHFLERALGRAPPLPQLKEVTSRSSTKRHLMIAPQQESVQRRWELEAEDTGISVIPSSGCFSSVWQMRVRLCCDPEFADAPLKLSRLLVRPKCGGRLQSSEELPVWSGDANGVHTPL